MTIKGFKQNKRGGARMSECPDWLQFNGRVNLIQNILTDFIRARVSDHSKVMFGYKFSIF